MFVVRGPNAHGVQASFWCQTAVTPYGYTERIPLMNFDVPPGAPQTQFRDVVFGNLLYEQFFLGQVDKIDGSRLTSATLTMGVGTVPFAPLGKFLIDDAGNYLVDDSGNYIYSG